MTVGTRTSDRHRIGGMASQNVKKKVCIGIRKLTRSLQTCRQFCSLSAKTDGVREDPGDDVAALTDTELESAKSPSAINVWYMPFMLPVPSPVPLRR